MGLNLPCQEGKNSVKESICGVRENKNNIIPYLLVWKVGDMNLL
jgi:hypothetical protein